MDLSGKSILVTGAAGSGVGAGVCRALVEAGARLVVNDLAVNEAEAARERHGAVAAYAADVADEEQVAAMYERIAADVGVLAGVVNNAGIGLNKPAWEVSVEEYERLQGVDMRGVWLVSRAFARQAIAAGRGGSIVNISSVHAHSTIAGYALYAGAKAAVEGLTRGLAVDLGSSGVRCNAVAPGYVHSEQNEELLKLISDDPAGWIQQHINSQQALERQIDPIDCGWAAAFLLSEKSRAITGQTLRVDAGSTAMLYDRDVR